MDSLDPLKLPKTLIILNYSAENAGLRIPLDKDFFQSKIIDKKGSFELKDVASFIRYFRGFKAICSRK